MLGFPMKQCFFLAPEGAWAKHLGEISAGTKHFVLELGFLHWARIDPLVPQAKRLMVFH